ncbi:MAG: helix-turn-helix domain containing protein [Candidatus Omnitrophica bacterium]|nr:helix-turn-helix domain containing protein [Candidatus Omnitrophota bacterium]
MKQSKDKKQWRYQMVQKAVEIGIKPTAKAFHTSPPVVRKWLKRFKQHGYAGLADRSRRPHHCPNETPTHLKEHVIELRKTYKRLGAEQIKVLEDIPLNPKTIRKIWRQAGCSSRRDPRNT